VTIVADTRLGFYISKQAFQLFSTKYLFFAIFIIYWYWWSISRLFSYWLKLFATFRCTWLLQIDQPFSSLRRKSWVCI